MRSPLPALLAFAFLLGALSPARAATDGQLSSSAWLPDGRAALVIPAGDGMGLLVSRDVHPRTLADFEPAARLFGDSGGVASTMPESVRLAVAGESLQVFFVANGRVGCATAPLPLSARTRWRTFSEPLAGTVRLQAIEAPSGAPAVLALQHEDGKTGSNIHRVGLADGALELRLVVAAPDYVAGADGFVDEDGSLHLAWSEAAPEQPVQYRCFSRGGEPSNELLSFLGGGQHPSIIREGDGVLVATEDVTGGVEVRWISGGRIERAENLGGRMHFRPELLRDLNGVVWLFALDADRRALWYRRLLGRDFDVERTAYGVQGRWVHELATGVPPRFAHGTPGFNLLHHEDLPEGGAPRFRFDMLPVPTLSANDSRRVLFIDLLEVSALDNAAHRLGIALKSEANPLDINGPAGSADEAWVDYADVMYDDGRFRMWYTGNTNTFERNWNIAYAESADGIHWTKPQLGIVPFRGSRANNLLFPNFKDPSKEPEGRNSAVGLVMRDDTDADPSRRYKMVMQSATLDGEAALYLTTSPDGIHWSLPPVRLWGKGNGRNPVIRGQTPWVEPLSTFLRDPIDPRDDYRWKIYGIDSYAGHPHIDVSVSRSLGMVHGSTPEDFVPFPHNPLIDPRTGADEDQNHGGLVQIYEGMYVGIYQHWSGPDWNVDLRLAASRDGIHFTRIFPDRPILPLGATGEWDSGMLCTPNSLVIRDDRIWLYYRGSVGTLANGRALSRSNFPAAKSLREPWRQFTGLARLRIDGFACLTVPPLKRKEYDHRTSFITDYDVKLEARVRSIPIDATGIDERTLHVNVGTLAPRFAWVKAQLRDADSGEVVPGHSFEDCAALEEDSLDHTFAWNGSPNLAGVRAKRVYVEFLLFGMLESPRFYSFWFE